MAEPAGSDAHGTAAAPAAGRLSHAAPVTELAGVGPTTATRLAAVGIVCCFDLVTFFPRRYRSLRDLDAPVEAAVGELVRLDAEVRNVSLQWLPGRRAMVTLTFACGDGSSFQAAFFNQPWLKKNYKIGERRRVEGVLQQKGKRFVVQQAKVLPKSAPEQGDVQLRYPDVDGISSPRLQGWIASVLDRLDWGNVTLPPLPDDLADHQMTAQQLLVAMHRPSDVEQHEHARRHFAVREALQLFEALERARRAREQRPAMQFPVDAALAERILARVPFALTGDQHAAVEQLWRRLAGPGAMGALLQGDVGSGKTAVAFAAALGLLARGGLVAFLAPTELLAEQQYESVSRWLAGTDVHVALCTASRRSELPQTGPRFVFGTHALMSSGQQLQGLGLVIVDEQHRFGVRQRMALIDKGDNPHVLVMTATPIPRTLSLVLFGDLDVVALTSRPPGRRAVCAFHVPTENWRRAVRSIARAVRRGGRVFVVCPAVGEQGEKGGVMRVVEALDQQFDCAHVHGRMKAADRQRALQGFRAGDIDVLVGTTVLEVGVDVPEATLMVVVAADRFGIATLHQLRGRVGRGRRRGIAVLCGPRTERVDAVCSTTDGFELAEKDLALRGGGELLGTQQSGMGDLRAFDPVEDLDLLRRVRQSVRHEA